MNTKIRKILALFLLVSAIYAITEVGVFADTPSTAGGSATLNANVHEVLIVSLSVPTTWAQGNTGDLLRNKITLGVTTNNPNGYTATMTTGGTDSTDTNLINTTCTGSINSCSDDKKIPTLGGQVAVANFANNTWGYSTDNQTYKGVPANAQNVTPAEINSSTAAVSNSTQDVYFASKIDASKASGTYVKTVNFNVVSGTINTETNPTTPTNPVTPSDDRSGTNNDSVATYTPAPSTQPANGYLGNSSTGVTVGTYTATTSATSGNQATDPVDGDKEKTITTVISGSAASSYSDPQGVNTTNNAEGVSTPAVAVLAGAAVATAAGGSATLLAMKFKG